VSNSVMRLLIFSARYEELSRHMEDIREAEGALEGRQEVVGGNDDEIWCRWKVDSLGRDLERAGGELKRPRTNASDRAAYCT
jgi:hypothetical protein